MSAPAHPLAVGARVHHRGGIYSANWKPAVGEGGSYWGTVLQVVPQHDRNYEYEVQADAAVLPGYENKPRWWASYHIDRVLA